MARTAAALTLVLSLTALGPGRARATVAGEVRELTLDDALALGRLRSNSIVAERARLAQAQTAISSAWALLLPTINAQGKYTRNSAEFKFVTGGMNAPMGAVLTLQPINQLDGVVSFLAPLIVPAAYPGLQAVKASVHSSEANFEVSTTDVLFAVAQSFYAAGIADEVLVARHSSIEVTKATLDNAKTRLSAGTVTKVDVDRAELALLRAEQLERDARHGRDQSYRTLATLIQLDTPFRVSPPPLPSGAPPADQDLGHALQLRPEFRAIEMSTKAAHDQARTDALKWSPSISAFGNVHRFNYQNFNFQDYSWAVGLELDWVIFDGGARDAQRHQANAQQAEAEARAAVLRDNIRDDLANNRDLLETKQRALESATRSVELARETIDLVRTQYEAGSVTQVDLLQAQDGLVSALEALAQAHFDVASADLSLRRAAGTFPPR